MINAPRLRCSDNQTHTSRDDHQITFIRAIHLPQSTMDRPGQMNTKSVASTVTAKRIVPFGKQPSTEHKREL